jgi:predicted metalloprotease with PDZ domain
MPDAPVQYTVVPANPSGHLFAVTLDIARPDPEGQVLRLPAWIPGSYLIRDFAMHIVHLRAGTADGSPVTARKRDKQTWVLDPIDGPVTVVYEVYAWDLSVRKAHLDRTHGYFNGTSLFLEVVGQASGPHDVTLRPPDDPTCTGWRVATTLPRTSGEPLGFGTFQAPDYDALIDHPVELGTFVHARFEARGIPHEVALTGRFRCDLDRLCADLQAICEVHLDMLGAPTDLDRYLFQIMVVGKGYGGLEHRSSTSLICTRDDLPQPGQDEVTSGYRTLLALASHEYFHTWNVKRIKPARFTPFDLSREAHTTLLWAFEGVTAYYEPLGVRRAGRIPPEDLLELLGRKLTDVMRRPGRFKQSVAESSFDAWTRFYKQDENALNAIVSYYTKGAMVALALDLTLRRDTDGATSLDDVMRALWQAHGETGVGVDEDGIQAITRQVSGLDLEAFFEEALHGTGDALWEQVAGLLADFGVTATLRVRESGEDRGGKPGTLSEAQAARRGDVGIGLQGTKVRWVREGSPAMHAGLSAGDEIVAFDGLKAGSDLAARIAGHRPGEIVPVHVFRRDELHTLTMTVGEAPRDTVALTLNDDAPPEAVARREAWLGA